MSDHLPDAFRLFIRQRRMLEWVTAAQSKVRARLDILGSYRWMCGGVALAAAAALIVWRVQPRSWPVAAPFLILWALSPAAARWASLPLHVTATSAISDANARALRLIARRTWRFFETFVTAEHHHLPPDNFQEDPKPVVAHRTSPTNMGLYLLAVVAARDFGWLGTQDAVDRLDLTLAAMKSLPCFQGHFYNWYDTHDLRPLDPKYVSAVDSGNLAGHLIALGSACREMLAAPLVAPAWLDGIADGIAITRESLRLVADDRSAHSHRHPQTPGGGARGRVERPVDARPAHGVGRSSRSDLPRRHAHRHRANAQRGARRRRQRRRAGLRGGGAWLRSKATGAISISRRPGAPTPCRAGERAGRRRPAGRRRSSGRRRPCAEGATRGHDRPHAVDVRRDGVRTALRHRTSAPLIGYQVAEGRLDASYYDLLASEARLASFIAIAKGDVPTKHWFHLGRTVTPVHSKAALISWSGSMFEYLMPLLVMRAPYGCLIDETNRTVVDRQIEYGAERGLPWGVSESAYNARDLEFTYQYSSFGVPGLGLKRGLGDDAVVAPYATALAAMIAPEPCGPELLAHGQSGWQRPVRLVRGARLHTVPPPGRRAGGHRARLHGAPSGHDGGRHRQRASSRGDARPLSRRADRAGDRAPAAGTNAA